ncbi:hypothetical protein FQN53_007654 [Emmonsiellopsis sp. PD_33]|nr:hypothetical protein FQN53_007654 [Emmonsiellopsis sp. PD_33]
MRPLRPFNAIMGADPADDPLHHFETSWLFPPFILGALRGLISLYCFVTIIFIFAWQGAHDDNISSRRSFSYFTHLTYWGVAFYFLFAAIHTLLYASRGRSVLFDKWPRGLRALHSLFYTTITTFPFLVLAVYWAMLYEGPWFPATFQAWTNISQHAMPPFFSLFEILFSTIPPSPPLHIPFLILILAFYLALAYITYASQGFYTYSFLDPGPGRTHSARVAGYSFGILAAAIVIFGIVWVITWARQRVVGGGKKTKWATKGVAGAGRNGNGNGNGWDAEAVDLAERK